MNRLILLLCAMIPAAILTQICLAETAGPSCPHCGCCQVKQVCRLVPEMKKEIKTVYSVECQDTCLPGKSKKCGTECVTDECTGCQKTQTLWQPTCGMIVTKKKLKKETITTEKPSFKCVLETVCCQCGQCCGK